MEPPSDTDDPKKQYKYVAWASSGAAEQRMSPGAWAAILRPCFHLLVGWPAPRQHAWCKATAQFSMTGLAGIGTRAAAAHALMPCPAPPPPSLPGRRYPFTSCEVLCCEVEAVFNTLLEDEELMALLFSLLDQPPPLSAKVAGYFGRVVGLLLLRKTNEMMQVGVAAAAVGQRCDGALLRRGWACRARVSQEHASRAGSHV